SRTLTLTLSRNQAGEGRTSQNGRGRRQWQPQPPPQHPPPPDGRPPPFDAIACAAAATPLESPPRAANTDISRVSRDPRQSGHSASSSCPARTSTSTERSQSEQ